MTVHDEIADYLARVQAADQKPLLRHVRDAMTIFMLGCAIDPSPIPGTSNWDAIKPCGGLLLGPHTQYGAAVKFQEGQIAIGTTDSYFLDRGLQVATSRNLGISSHDLPAVSSMSVYCTERADADTTTHFLRHPGSYRRGIELRTDGSISYRHAMAVTGVIEDASGLGLVSFSTATQGIIDIWHDGFAVSQERNQILNGTPGEMHFASDGHRLAFFALGGPVNQSLLNARINGYIDAIIQGPPVRGFPLSRLVN